MPIDASLDSLSHTNDNDGTASGITSIAEAYAAALAELKVKGIAPTSPEGRKILTQITSSAGQAFDQAAPLPNTRSNEDITAGINSRKKIE